MKINLQATINNMSLRKDGEYRVEFRIPYVELEKAITTVQFIGNSFFVMMIAEEVDDTGERVRAVIKEAYFYKMIVDREGESKIVISFLSESIDDLAFFGKHQEEVIDVLFKSNFIEE